VQPTNYLLSLLLFFFFLRAKIIFSRLNHRGLFSEHIIWVCESVFEAVELSGRDLLNSNLIVLVDSIHDLKVLPRAEVLVEGGGVCSSEEISQLVLVYVLKKSLLIVFSLDLDFLSGFLVQPPFDHCPNSRECSWRITDHHLTKLFRIVVLRDF